jgi:hypothetical protein
VWAANSGAVYLSTCNTSADMYWLVEEFYSYNADWWRLRNCQTKRCLLVRGDLDDAKAVTYTCGQWAKQVWWFEVAGTGVGVHKVWNQNSGKCLVGRATQYSPQQCTCGSLADQLWDSSSGNGHFV